MTLRLREIIDANLQNACIKISARNVANHGPSPLDKWSAWARDFLGGSDGTVEDAEKARGHARRYAHPYNPQDDTCRLAVACQELAEAVSALLQHQPDVTTANRLIMQARQRLDTIE